MVVSWRSNPRSESSEDHPPVITILIGGMVIILEWVMYDIVKNPPFFRIPCILGWDDHASFHPAWLHWLARCWKRRCHWFYGPRVIRSYLGGEVISQWLFFQWISTMGYNDIWVCSHIGKYILTFDISRIYLGLFSHWQYIFPRIYCLLTMIFGFVWKLCILPNSRHVGHDEPLWDMDYITSLLWCAMLLENVVEPPR